IHLISLADAYAGRDDEGAYSVDRAAQPTLECNDAGPQPRVTDVEGQIRFLEDYYAAAPFTDPRTEDEPDRGMEVVEDRCTHYEESNAPPGARRVSAMPNIFTGSTPQDPTAPFDHGVVAAASLGGTLLAAAGDTHTSYGSLARATDIINEYVHTLKVPTDIT